MNRSQFEDDIDHKSVLAVWAAIAVACLVGWVIAASLDGVFRGFGL